MRITKKTQCSKQLKPTQPRLSKAELDALVEEATVDCYNESEQATGIYTMIKDNLQLPFETEVLGVAVTVTGIDITNDDQIVAICKRGGRKQKLPILDLPHCRPRDPSAPSGSRRTAIGRAVDRILPPREVRGFE